MGNEESSNEKGRWNVKNKTSNYCDKVQSQGPMEKVPARQKFSAMERGWKIWVNLVTDFKFKVFSHFVLTLNFLSILLNYYTQGPEEGRSRTVRTCDGVKAGWLCEWVKSDKENDIIYMWNLSVKLVKPVKNK